MKKINLLVIALAFGALSVYANPVDVNTAQKVAGNFYTSTYSATNPTLSLAYTERDADGVPVYYVFNVNSNKGFVIVTADDAAHPIIGYSDKGSYVIPTTNNNVSFWMQKRKNEVIAMRTQHVSSTPNIADEWTSYASGTIPRTHNVSSNPILQLCSTEWNQEPFYNAYCPGGSVTGCVATAMAQILRYWSYPSVGTGSNCYNDEMSQGYTENYGELCATFDTSHYVWSAMPISLGGDNNQISKLMYDCGISVDMDYSPSGSGAQVMGGWGASAFNSYTAYFGYDRSTINEAMYSSYTDAEWIALLESEINMHRPMQFEGTDPSQGGHSWVCDGYTSLNAMHMNWGWGGSDDGWYSVDALNPSGFDFSEYIGVIYGIQPPGVAGVKQISDNTSINVYPNPSHGVFTFEMPNNNNSTYQLKVYNVLGEEVNTSTIHSENTLINLSNQAKGVYIYKVLGETGTPISNGRLVVE